MFPLMAMLELQDALLKQMMMASTHAFFVTMIPVQFVRTIWPVPLAAPQPKGRACMPFRHYYCPMNMPDRSGRYVVVFV